MVRDGEYTDINVSQCFSGKLHTTKNFEGPHGRSDCCYVRRGSLGM